MTTDFTTVYRAPAPSELRIERAEVRGPSGAPYPHYRLMIGGARVSATVIATDGPDILVVRQWRAALGREMIELPRGWGDSADGSAQATGVRELREETGLPAASATVIGQYVTDTAIYPQEVAVVRARVDRTAGTGRTDGEIAESRWVSISDLDGLIASGVLSDAHSLAAIAVWRAQETEES